MHADRQTVVGESKPGEGRGKQSFSLATFWIYFRQTVVEIPWRSVMHSKFKAFANDFAQQTLPPMHANCKHFSACESNCSNGFSTHRALAPFQSL